MNIKEYLKRNILLTDGAMGTWFDSLEPENYLCSEAANYLNPGLIQKIHRSYIEKGAQLIRSNTFAANRGTYEKLCERDGVLFREGGFSGFVKAGYELARQEAEKASREGKPVYAAADIGPIFEDSESEPSEVCKQYYELADIFLEAGADIFVLETFPDEEYVLKLAQYIKNKKVDVFIIGQFSFVPTGYSRTGHFYKNVLKKAILADCLDAVGLNCGIGAAHMEKFYKEFLSSEEVSEKTVLTALPNCGYPQIVRGKAVYSDSVNYFGEKAAHLAEMGIRILGGCCGTTPEYIGELSRRLFGKNPTAVKTMPQKIHVTSIKKEENKSRKNRFREKLEAGEKVLALELDPPFDACAEKMMDGAKLLSDSGIDVITIADSPLARARADSLLMAAKIQRDTGIMTMPHLSCRDRNRIAIRSGLLGAHISDVRNLLIVTGDPVGRDEREFTKAVFDFNSIKLMKYVRGMNEEIFCGDELFYGGALNQNGANPEKIAERMKKKMEAGCSFFLTQPVYSEEELERLRWLRNETGAKILIGIMPLISYRNALFIKNEMPGIYVPDEVLLAYSPDGTREEWEETAIRICSNVMRKGKDIGAGYYLITPFHRVSLMKKILTQM